MLRIQKILVPLDCSDVAEDALQVAHALARDHQARLILVTAPPPPPLTTEVPVLSQDYEGIAEEARRYLTSVAAKINDLPVETRVLTGDPGAMIVSAAQEIPADLIVMSTHGRSGLSRVLMGSVAEYVLRHAPCPVLTIKPNTVQHLSQEEETALAKPNPPAGSA